MRIEIVVTSKREEREREENSSLALGIFPRSRWPCPSSPIGIPCASHYYLLFDLKSLMKSLLAKDFQFNCTWELPSKASGTEEAVYNNRTR